MIETFLNKGFLKTFDIPSSLDVDKIEKNRSASDEPTPSNGDWIFLVVQEGKQGLNFYCIFPKS